MSEQRGCEYLPDSLAAGAIWAEKVLHPDAMRHLSLQQSAAQSYHLTSGLVQQPIM